MQITVTCCGRFECIFCIIEDYCITKQKELCTNSLASLVTDKQMNIFGRNWVK